MVTKYQGFYIATTGTGVRKVFNEFSQASAWLFSTDWRLK